MGCVEAKPYVFGKIGLDIITVAKNNNNRKYSICVTQLFLYSVLFSFSAIPLVSMSTLTGNVATFPCGNNMSSSAVDWYYEPFEDARGYQIISDGNLPNGDFDGRLRINGSTLTLNNVRTSDGGIFSCVTEAGHGKRYQVNFTVLGKLPAIFVKLNKNRN